MKPAYLARANRGNRQILDLLVAMALELGAEVFIEQSLALRDRRDYLGALKAFAGLALVLCGEEDALYTPTLHREIAALLHHTAPFVVAGAGHITTLERPEAVNSEITNWLLVEM